jgi:arsenate reductase-like glutaredoxin family protein
MPIQIWEAKGFDSQKAVRYFQERKIPVQRIDLLRFGISRRELESVRAQVGLEGLFDRQSRAFAESTVRYSDNPELIFQALLDHPKLLRVPIVRNGKLATVGYCPEVWAGWPK